MEIIETYLSSKKGNKTGGEDRLILGPNFYGVVDGATDKSGNNWGTEQTPKTGGQVLADIVKSNLEKENTPNNKTLEQKLNLINSQIHSAANTANIDLRIENNRADAGFAAYTPKDKCIYHIHDCVFGFVKEDGEFEVHTNDKQLDQLTSSIRKQMNEWYLSQGINPFENGKDLGREYIMPMLKNQQTVQNQGFESNEEWMNGIPKSTVAYRTINGFKTQVSKTKIPKGTKEIIISSDGFKTLKPTLQQTLETLKFQLQNDPHCMNELLSTKGLNQNQISFDDMSYIRIKL
jgi:hypothetical protein